MLRANFNPLLSKLHDPKQSMLPRETVWPSRKFLGQDLKASLIERHFSFFFLFFFFFASFCEMPLLWIPKAKQELIGVLHVHIPMLAYFSEGSLFQLDIAILTLSKE